MDLKSYLEQCQKHYDEGCHLLTSTLTTKQYHGSLPVGSRVHDVRQSVSYATGLLRDGSKENSQRAEEITGAVLALQDTIPTSQTYGIWPRHLEEPLELLDIPDHNFADFVGAQLVALLAAGEGKLSDDVTAAVQRALGHAGWAIFRRNVGPDYTNVAFSGGVVTAAIGEMLGEVRLLDYGRRRLRSIIEAFDYEGEFNEYNCPGYALSCIRWTKWAGQYVRDEGCLEAARRLHRLLWQSYADHFHPGTGQLAGPQARAYANWPGEQWSCQLGDETGVDIVFRGDKPSPAGPDQYDRLGDESWRCPTDIAQRFRELPEPVMELRHRYVRRDPEEDSIWGTTWLTQEACLGSVNHENVWYQRRVVLGYWKTPQDPAVVLRLRFLHDGQDFGSAYICSAQKGCRVLSLVSLLTDKGDWHDHIDRPIIDGRFSAEDFRVRYELTGRGVQGRALGSGRFELSAGSYRAVIHTAPGRFGEYELSWHLDQRKEGPDDQVVVDGVCYHGSRRPFQFQQLGDVIVGAALELLDKSQRPAAGPLEIAKINDDTLRATWQVGSGLEVTGPAHAMPYRYPHACEKLYKRLHG